MLVHLADNVDELKHENGAFDLAPARKGGSIASIEMGVRDGRRLDNGFLAKTLDEDRGLVEGKAVINGLDMHFAVRSEKLWISSQQVPDQFGSAAVFQSVFRHSSIEMADRLYQHGTADTWMRRPAMTSPAGLIIALGVLLGAVIGLFLGEASAGFLIGLALGILLAICVHVLSGAGDRPR